MPDEPAIQRPKNNALVKGLIGTVVGGLIVTVLIGTFSLALQARSTALSLSKDIESVQRFAATMQAQLDELEAWKLKWAERVLPLDKDQDGRLRSLERRMDNLE